MKYVSIIICSILFTGFLACKPNTVDQEGREATKADTLDVNQGEGEGDLGEGEISGNEDM